jgi:predicted transposase/invertase (TIGR01784 family)
VWCDLDFEYLPLALYHSVFQLKEKQTNQLLTDALEIHFIELPKLCKTNQVWEDPLVNWMLFLEGPSDATLEVLAMKDPAIRKAWTVLELLSQDEEARRLYEMREKALHYEISMLNGAKAEASTEAKSRTQREIALNLLLAGVDISIITNTTGLTEAEVKALKQ